MGTMITLDVDGMSIDWNKNNRGTDHGALFQMEDRRRVISDQINYGHFEPEDPELAEMEMAFVRRLADVVPRLELMGFSIATTETAYNRASAASNETSAALNEITNIPLVEPMSFTEFKDFIRANPINDLDDNAATERIPFSGQGNDGYSGRSHLGSLLSFLHPYAVLPLLAENPANHDAKVVWQYGPLVSNGWADVSEFEPCARRGQTFLIATEGSSDALILKHALSLLRPEIADFFRFVDMSDGFPFTGTGSLKNFATGLAAIDVHNQVLFLLDNDAEGVYACTQIESLQLPANMRVTCLPNQVEFRTVPCIGPEGRQVCDINGRAAAIECYLDLSASGQPPAEVRWSNYMKPLDCYHGALQAKERYTRVFFKQTGKTLTDGTYDTTKISSVLDHIFAVCTQMAAQTNRMVQEAEQPYLW